MFFADALTTLYARLDPTSVAEHFAFYELYPQTPQGREALKHAWELLSGGEDPEFLLPDLDIQPLISLVNRSNDTTPKLPSEQLASIDRIARPLANRSLRGFGCPDLKTLLSLPDDEIDLARGLLVAEGTHTPLEIQSYEATLDLMALQILARLPPEPTSTQKIRALNDYVFHEMRFRFPPHSLYAQDIDLYTFLPSVLDSRRGVCLGVSILYLSLAQRLDLPLEAVTPPGHIYLRYRIDEGDEINIETTARGLDLPSEVYLGIETRSLQTRTVREVIGLAFMNQASVAWHRKDPKAAIGLYEKSLQFLPHDPLPTFFLGLNHLFAGNVGEGRLLLSHVRHYFPEHSTFPDSVADDYLDGHCDIAALEAIFSEVDASRNSILAKQALLKETTNRCPLFRQGHFNLAITYLQLGREKEAIEALTRYLTLEPNDPTANYYLSMLALRRFDYPKAWNHFRRAEAMLIEREHYPQALESLREALSRASPET